MCKRDIDCLPDDLLLKILLERLLAEDIFESVMLVCRKWYNMTNTSAFTYAHLQHTDYVHLFQSASRDDFSISRNVRHSRVQVSKSRNTFEKLYSGSCNGLMLETDLNTLYIVNPVMKQKLALPLLRGMTSLMCGITYAESSKVYKVVATFHYEQPNLPEDNNCCILTVGVDSWRSVSCAHLTYAAKITFIATPLVKILTMDVETEVIIETPPPFPLLNKHRRTYLSTGKYLTFLVSFIEHSWEVWEMKPRIGEWRKVRNFSLESQKRTIEHFGSGQNTCLLC